MGCNCKKNARQEPQVITSTPEPTVVPQTPEELHTLELNEHGKMLMEKYKNLLDEDNQEN